MPLLESCVLIDYGTHNMCFGFQNAIHIQYSREVIETIKLLYSFSLVQSKRNPQKLLPVQLNYAIFSISTDFYDILETYMYIASCTLAPNIYYMCQL